jgi:glutamate racemase
MDAGMQRLQQAPAVSQVQRQTMSRAVMVLARRAAIKEVKVAIQRQGRRKVWQIAYREIVAIAEDYLAANRAKLNCGGSKVRCKGHSPNYEQLAYL